MKQLRRGLLTASLTAALTTVANAATPGVDAPPPPEPPRPIAVPALSQQRLPNGIMVVTAPQTATPVVSIALLLRTGPEADLAGHAGVAAMTAALWPKGAVVRGRAMSATQIARAAEQLGGQLDSGSGWRGSTLTMTVTTPQLEPALALMAGVLRHPTLAAGELERLRAQTLDGLRVALGSPAEVAGMALRRAFWGETPYGNVAPPAAIRRLTRADVQRFQAQWVRPDNVALVLAGDVDAARALALAQRLLGDWPAPKRPLPAPASQQGAAPAVPALTMIDLPGAGQTSVAVAAPFVSSTAADRRAGQVANAVLGGGYSARLNQEVRIRRGLSYGAFSDAEAHPPGGMVTAQAQTAHPNAPQVLALLRGETARIATDPPAADELAARQATLIGSFGRRLETTQGLASLMMGELSQGRPLDGLRNTVDEILAVDAAAVSAFARRHWQAEALRAVVVGDLKATGNDWPGSDVQRLTIDALDLERAGLAKK